MQHSQSGLAENRPPCFMTSKESTLRWLLFLATTSPTGLCSNSRQPNPQGIVTNFLQPEFTYPMYLSNLKTGLCHHIYWISPFWFCADVLTQPHSHNSSWAGKAQVMATAITMVQASIWAAGAKKVQATVLTEGVGQGTVPSPKRYSPPACCSNPRDRGIQYGCWRGDHMFPTHTHMLALIRLGRGYIFCRIAAHSPGFIFFILLLQQIQLNTIYVPSTVHSGETTETKTGKKKSLPT